MDKKEMIIIVITGVIVTIISSKSGTDLFTGLCMTIGFILCLKITRNLLGLTTIGGHNDR